MACTNVTEERLKEIVGEEIQGVDKKTDNVIEVRTVKGNVYYKKTGTLPGTDAQYCHTIAHTAIDNVLYMEKGTPLLDFFAALEKLEQKAVVVQLTQFVVSVLSCCIENNIAMPDLKPDNVVVLDCGDQSPLEIPVTFRIIDLEDIGPLDMNNNTHTFSIREIEEQTDIAKKRAARTIFSAVCVVLMLPELVPNSSTLRKDMQDAPATPRIDQLFKKVPSFYEIDPILKQTMRAAVAATKGVNIYDHPMLRQYPTKLGFLEAVLHCRTTRYFEPWTTRDGCRCAVSEQNITVMHRGKARTINVETDNVGYVYLTTNDGAGFTVDGALVVGRPTVALCSGCAAVV